MTDRLTEIEARLGAATLGPWSVNNPSTDVYEIRDADDLLVADIDDIGSEDDVCAEFIAHSPEDIKWLVEEVKRLRERLRVYASAHYEAPIMRSGDTND